MTDKIKYIVGKEYKLGDKVVRVLAIDRPVENNIWRPIVVMDVEAGGLFSLAKNGSYGSEQLTEIKPWDTLKPGDLCMVGYNSLYIFAGVINGRPYTWSNRLTPMLWSTCRPLTEEEMAKVKKGV